MRNKASVKETESKMRLGRVLFHLPDGSHKQLESSHGYWSVPWLCGVTDSVSWTDSVSCWWPQKGIFAFWLLFWALLDVCTRPLGSCTTESEAIVFARKQ